MRGIITFEDDFINNKEHKFEINLNTGEVYILNYNCLDKLSIGKYKKVDDLPNESNLYDIKTIPEIRELHNWIEKQYDDLYTFLNVKDLIINDFNSAKNFDDLLAAITRYKKRIEIEIRSDDVFF